MHIAVVLRLGPDLTEELEVGESGNEIDREWIGIKLNDLDDQALEEAVLLKERSGAKVTAIALAGEGAERQLQAAIARGADDALAITHALAGTTDARATALMLAPILQTLAVDLVLTGVQSSEDVFGQLAPYLAGTLGWRTVNAVNGVAVTGDRIEVTQEYSGGYAAAFSVALPAVLGIQAASQPPRYVSGSKLRQATGLAVKTAAGVLPDGFETHMVTRLAVPARSSSAEMLAGDAEAVVARLISVMTERGLVGA